MWPESNTPSKIEGAGGADVPQALFYPKNKTAAFRSRLPFWVVAFSKGI
jgi:hypothetical protein